MRPKTRLCGRFFECVPNAKSDASFFCARNSMGVASSNGCTALCRLRCTPVPTVTEMSRRMWHARTSTRSGRARTVRLLEHEQVDKHVVDQSGGLLATHEQSRLRILIQLGLAVSQEALGFRRLGGPRVDHHSRLWPHAQNRGSPWRVWVVREQIITRRPAHGTACISRIYG
jgi:hypothetical protein